MVPPTTAIIPSLIAKLCSRYAVLDLRFLFLVNNAMTNALAVTPKAVRNINRIPVKVYH